LNSRIATILLGVLIITLAFTFAELGFQVGRAAAVKVGIESPELYLTSSGQASLPSALSINAFISGSPSSLSGAMDLVPTSSYTSQFYSCASSVTGSESRTVNPTISLTEQHACVADLRDVTATVVAYMSTGQITLSLFSTNRLVATYTGNGTVTMTFGCDFLSNHNPRVKAPGF
jgi:hypothetical protein